VKFPTNKISYWRNSLKEFLQYSISIIIFKKMIKKPTETDHKKYTE